MERLSPFEENVQAEYGAAQNIEGLPDDFIFFGTGNSGGVLYHRLCQQVIARFNDKAEPASIVKATEGHQWCPAAAQGIAVG